MSFFFFFLKKSGDYIDPIIRILNFNCSIPNQATLGETLCWCAALPISIFSCCMPVNNACRDALLTCLVCWMPLVCWLKGIKGLSTFALRPVNSTLSNSYRLPFLPLANMNDRCPSENLGSRDRRPSNKVAAHRKFFFPIHSTLIFVLFYYTFFSWSSTRVSEEESRKGGTQCAPKEKVSSKGQSASRNWNG